MTTRRTLMGYAAVLGLVASTGMGMAQDREGWPATIGVATASQGGTYSVVGAGMAALIAEKLGVGTSAETTGGPVQNVTLVETGDLQLGLVTLGPAKDAIDGKSELAPGMAHTQVRALFPMYVTPFQSIVLKSSGITDVKGLNGKRVGIGPASGTAATYWPRFLETLGVKIEPSYAGGADMAGQLGDGLLDAISFAGGVPIPFFSQIAAESEAVMFGMTAEEQATVLAAHPEFSAFNIKAGTYSGIDYDQLTVGLWNFTIANSSMPETLAYEITKTVLENNEYMQTVHKVTAEMIAANWENNKVIPFHAGAARYYKEIGIEIPAEMIGE